MIEPARVAFFTDSFHEVNGVALTSRQFDAFARRRQIPFLSVHAGAATREIREGSNITLELGRGLFSFDLESDLSFDVGLWRHYSQVERAVRELKPDLINITGP